MTNKTCSRDAEPESTFGGTQRSFWSDSVTETGCCPVEVHGLNYNTLTVVSCLGFCICVRLATYAAKMPTSTNFLCVERQLWSNDMDSESERGSGDIEKAAESDN